MWWTKTWEECYIGPFLEFRIGKICYRKVQYFFSLKYVKRTTTVSNAFNNKAITLSSITIISIPDIRRTYKMLLSPKPKIIFCLDKIFRILQILINLHIYASHGKFCLLQKSKFLAVSNVIDCLFLFTWLTKI